MSKDSTKHATPDFGAGHELLDALKESGILTEARHSIIKNVTMILESRSTPTEYIYNNVPVNWDVFHTVYTDYDRYEKTEEVLYALGFPRAYYEASGSKDVRGTMHKALERMVKHFRSTNPEAHDLVMPGGRMKSYSKRFKAAHDVHDAEQMELPFPPTRDAIDPGRKNRVTNATRVIDRINSQELIAGEFYSDFSRIPPSRWGSWLRFWDKEKTSVQQDHRLFGRSWRKTFVLGYQLEQNFVYEIWYNSVDSTFAVHDQRGNQMTRRFPTLSEAMKALTNAIAQSSTQDTDVFKAGMNNQIAASMMRSMASGLDQHIIDLQRIDDKEQKEVQARRHEAEKLKAAADAEDAKKRAEAERARKETFERVKVQMKRDMANATSRIFRDVGKIGVMAADVALEQFKAGAISLEKFLQNVSDSLDLKDSPEEKDLRGALMDEEIDLGDYISGIRELAAKRRADKLKAETDKKMKEASLAKRRAAAAAKKSATTSNSTNMSVEDYLAKKKSPTGGEGMTFESLLENEDFYASQEASVDDAVAGDHMASIRVLRNDAQKGQYTQKAIKHAVNSELITTYNETRVDQNFPRTILPNWINKGRKAPIVLPTDKPSIWNRAKMLIKGVRYQADFIVGFSIADRVNIEVWYITEPNPEHTLIKFGAGDEFTVKPAVSSFYIFDVTSGKLLRKYVPYYRNAVQIAMGKLSAQ